MTTIRYFRLTDRKDIPGRWLLSDPIDAKGQPIDDPLHFAQGLPVPAGARYRIAVERPGKALDFSLPSAGVTPIVHKKVATLFTELAPGDVQAIPVDINGQSEPYFILVATRNVRCIDDRACEKVEFWKPEDGEKELVGQYRSVVGLRIDPAKVGGVQVFRPWGWTVALIVSETIKTALERARVSGMAFKEVTGSKPG
ncbi:hypothetical protein CYFUS_006865 [Cystobacter fuscus]|uniref:Immunity MXAN-0049 protein domain-containing protein n=1 Tax=Cystobacter fuscus TaxID=43 RepID=A0A250JBW4_9BACT|nr:DUF1629 domain-containing protein [Cystobacter fuscus]ATB41399.1 hypothetical protein CYFUS_006865 [Cystobacter fuscus]